MKSFWRFRKRKHSDPLLRHVLEPTVCVKTGRVFLLQGVESGHEKLSRLGVKEALFGLIYFAVCLNKSPYKDSSCLPTIGYRSGQESLWKTWRQGAFRWCIASPIRLEQSLCQRQKASSNYRVWNWLWRTRKNLDLENYFIAQLERHVYSDQQSTSRRLQSPYYRAKTETCLSPSNFHPHRIHPRWKSSGKNGPHWS